MFSQKVSPPAINGCSRVTSVMSSVLVLNGNCRFRGRPVDMLLISCAVSPFPRLLVQYAQFTVPLYDESYWISGNVDDALERLYVRMSRSRFCSHHSQIMLMLFPLQRREKSEGGPPCNSIACPWCGLGLLSYKVPVLASTAS